MMLSQIKVVAVKMEANSGMIRSHRMKDFAFS